MILSHLDEIRTAAGASNLHIAMSFLVASLLAGTTSKNCGAALAYGVKAHENELRQPREPIDVDADLVRERMARAFIWPLSSIVRSSMRGVQKPLGTELRFAKFFSWQWATNVIYVLSGALGILWITVSSKVVSPIAT